MPRKTKTAEPELFSPGEGPKVAPLTEGTVRKGGRNVTTQVARRPPPPAPSSKPQAVSILQIAKEASTDPLVDAGKMQAIIGMAREEQNRLDEQAFETARLAVQNEMPPITKDTLNSHTRSKWARLEKISSIADPIIRAHGFTLAYGMADCPLSDHYRITCDVMHTPTGYKKHYFADIGMDAEGAKGGGTKSKAQGSGSSITYGRRFLKVMIFDINVVGEDFDGNRAQTESGPKISAEDVSVISDKLKIAGLSVERFCHGFKIKSIADLPDDLYEQAVKRIEDFAMRAKDQR